MRGKQNRIFAVGIASVLSLGLTSYAEDCGGLPENTQVNEYFRQTIKKMACAASDTSVNGAVPPIFLTYDKTDNHCTSDDLDETKIRNEVHNPLATPQGLLGIACGTEVCHLQNAGASQTIIDHFQSLCFDPYGGRGTQPQVRIVEPSPTVIVGKADFEKKRDVQLSVHGSADDSLPFKVTGENVELASPDRTLSKGIFNDVLLRVKIPKRVARGEPVYFPFRLSVGSGPNPLLLPGVIKIARDSRGSEGCSAWQDDQCLLCESTIFFRQREPQAAPFHGQCQDMPPGAKVRATFRGFVGTDNPPLDPQGQRQFWNTTVTMTLKLLDNPPSAQTNAGTLTGWSVFTVESDSIVPQSGFVEGQVNLTACASGTPKSDSCSTVYSDPTLRIEVVGPYSQKPIHFSAPSQAHKQR